MREAIPRAPALVTAGADGGWTDVELTVRLRRGVGGTVRVDGNLCRAPVWFRWDGATLWLVGSGASPVAPGSGWKLSWIEGLTSARDGCIF